LIPQSFIDELRQSSDIAEIIGGYVQLKRSGRLLKGLCPFHSEKTPSFTVFPQNGSFYCFGCQTGGSVITFIEKAEQLDFVEAVKWLANRAGIEVPDDGSSDGIGLLRRRIKEANREAARFFYRKLYTPAGAEALYAVKDWGWGVRLSTDGFEGKITLMVGIDVDGVVFGVEILDHSESRWSDDDMYLLQFVGLTADMLTEDAIDTVSGATLSSRAIYTGVTRALEIAAEQGLIPAAGMGGD